MKAARRLLPLFSACSILMAQPPQASTDIREGTRLDLEGKTAEAKASFQKAIDSAANPAAKANAQRAMAMSYAFDGDCRNTGRYEQMVIDYWKTQEQAQPANAFYQEGEMANEAARVCIDNAALDEAERWYRAGREMGLKEPNIAAGRKLLWEYRTEHALARLAARRGNQAEAQKHVAAAKAVLEQMQKADEALYNQQKVFLPYLTGYVALYTGDTKTALADLQQANTNDAFIQCLIGMAYEKAGENEKAMEWYRKASAAAAHNPPAAFAKPFTRKKLAGGTEMPAVAGKPVEQATLRYVDVKAGDGAAASWGKLYVVQYTGWLRDGTQFDSSVGKKPFTFVQGRREVIPGFDAGFEGMKAGGKRRLFIPYQMAYGEQQRGKIPPRSELIFDVELLEVKDAPANGGPAAELLFAFNGTADRAIELLKAFPDEKLDWRPAAGVRSVREVAMHMALGNRLMLEVSNGAEKDALAKQIAENAKREGEKLTKAEVVAAMQESFEALRGALRSTTPGSLGRGVDFFGEATTRRGVLTALDTHLAEHFGQLIAYARMNGVVPPWSR